MMGVDDYIRAAEMDGDYDEAERLREERGDHLADDADFWRDIKEDKQ